MTMQEYAIKGDASLDEITGSIRSLETNDLQFVDAEIKGGRTIVSFEFVDEKVRTATVVLDGSPAPAGTSEQWSGKMRVGGNTVVVRLFREDPPAQAAAPPARIVLEAAAPALMRAGAAAVPKERPRLSHDELLRKIAPFGIDRTKHPLLVIGIRGYYKNSMGAPGVNDRGLYDDAIFVMSDQATVAFNGNTDPSSVREGHGTGAGKGMACLMPGVWYVHRFGMHKGKYLTLCQLGGNVTVLRDGRPPYVDTGMFGINIHKGGNTTTSSLGCQTIHPAQWPAFIALVEDQARRYFGAAWKKTVIPYVLIAE